MKKTELFKRYLLFVVSLLLSGVGVAFTKHGALGVSPISSLPNVISARFDFLSFGTWLMLWNCMLVLGQILILRRKFQPLQLLQIPLSVLFGWFTDLGGLIAAFIPADSYPMQLCMVISGILILGAGIALSVIADVIMNAGEAFVRTVADTTQKEFGNVKIAFDICNVTLALIASLILFKVRSWDCARVLSWLPLVQVLLSSCLFACCAPSASRFCAIRQKISVIFSKYIRNMRFFPKTPFQKRVNVL